MSAKVPPIPRICQNCGTEFLIIRWRLKDPLRGRFCSRDCAQRRSGENARHWRGGLSAITQQKRVGYKYVGLKKQLLKREFICRFCGSKKKLVMDHIIPMVFAPDKTYDLDNVQLLCQSCHISKTAIDKRRWKMVRTLEAQNA